METRQEHTPEEWHGSTASFPDWSGQGLVVSDSDGRNVAIVYDAKRDMALIATAPELLAVLDEALTWWHSIPRHFNQVEPAWLEKTRAAIRKATEG